MKRHAITFDTQRKNPVGHAGMQMHMLIEGRLEAHVVRKTVELVGVLFGYPDPAICEWEF